MPDPSGMLPTRSRSDQTTSGSPAAPPETLRERIRAATTAGGLASIPPKFSDPDGDWRTIQSESLFERLYLDADHSSWISPEIVRRNYEVLRRFWDEKIALLQQGAAETQIVQRFGGPDRNRNLILSYPARLREAAERLSDPGRMAQYVEQLGAEKAARARPVLENAIEMVFADGTVEPDEVRHFLKVATQAGETPDRAARMFEEALSSRRYGADGTPSGSTATERVTSVRWLSPERIAKRAKSSSASALSAVCNRCGSPPEPDSIFCQKCGNRLASASPGAVATTPVVPPAPTGNSPSPVVSGVTGAPMLHVGLYQPVPAMGVVADTIVPPLPAASVDGSPAGSRSRVLPIAVAILVLVAAIGGVIIYRRTLSFSARIDTALERGWIFTPAGNCVADLYAAEKGRSPDSQALRDAAAKIAARLAPMGEETFRRWYSESEGVDWNETERVYAFLEELQPGQPLVKARHEYALATLSLNRQRHAEALNHFNLALQADPSLVLAVNGIAKIYVQDSSPLKNDAAAIDYYQRAAAMDPGFTWAPKNLAEYYMRREEWRTAEMWMLKALATSPNRPSILRALARIYFNLQNYGQALDYNQRFLQVGTDPVEIARANSAIDDIRRRMR